MRASEAVQAKVVRIEAAARERGERLFPELPAPPIVLGIVAASFAASILKFVGALWTNGSPYAERAYLVVAATGAIAFLWSRNAIRRRAEALEGFVREETATGVAALALPDDIADDLSRPSEEWRSTIH